MATTMIVVGLGIAGSALLARAAVRMAGPAARQMDETLKTLGKFDFENYKYYRGGFETKMTKREAALILGIGQSSNRNRVRECHRRIMLLNHPDKGGSPYLAAKINQAKDMLDHGLKK
ncbi:mitochondrial import inner membrane translocase subunit TIM14-like [Styela clava]|uniref:mitochondrial import inner membrane translocase subunit TIM14-like n=1 Tax=Styela clava TaxID=7725 RepID=UPI00193A0322|nr:mitochondrial import inner membrane translocase subunit TIM14-like [Styela clava]